MRSPRELWFRLGQELANLRLWAFPPRPQLEQSTPLPGLVPPAQILARLRGSALAAEILTLAEKILQHRFPLLGVEIDAGPAIAWRRDYISGIETSPAYFRRIPYLDPVRAGDHKIVWELNRHQHLVLLAQSFLLSGDHRFESEIRVQLEHWEEANPYLCGINWASALEVAFRSLSWIWVYHLVGAAWTPEYRRRFLASLYRHGCYLEHNLSVYFSPNTHLLGEAVALHALGTLFLAFPRSTRWASLGARLAAEQMQVQVRDDGSHFEQSSYYQIYAIDFFLLHDVLSPPSERFRHKLAAMAGFLHALHTPAGTLPFLGDDDGGRLFHPYGSRERFGAATLSACAARIGRPSLRLAEDHSGSETGWWLPESVPPAPEPGIVPASRLFRGAGLAVLRAPGVSILVDAGTFGAMNGGHSHSDTLHVTVFAAGHELLLDPGTYTYVADGVWRQRFRGSAAHNTLRPNGLDQAIAGGPFSWRNHPQVELLAWKSSEQCDALDAVCSYAGFRHRRRIRFHKPDRLWILDDIEGPPGEHDIEQFWHPGVSVTPSGARAFRLGDCATLCLSAAGAVELTEGGEYGWRSLAPGAKQPVPVLRIYLRAALPLQLATVLDWRPAGAQANPEPADLVFLETLRLDP